jgi:hypothetical protein
MKNLTLRTSVALACAIGLLGCGGGDANLLLPVSISGVNKEGLTISNNGGPALAVPLGTAVFNFPDLIGTDADFDVKVVTSPSNAKCEVINGKGKTGAYSPNNILVLCTVNPYNVTGTVSGLKTSGLIVINGAERTEIPAGATTFTMTKLGADGKVTSGQVGDGYAYGLTIYQQPAAGSGVCTIQNGTGTMGAADVTNVKITCA